MTENLSKIIGQAPIGILTFTDNWKINYINENFLKFGILYSFDSSLIGVDILEKEIFPGISIQDDLLQLKEGYSFEKELKNITTINHGTVSLIIKGSPLFEENVFAGGILIIEDLRVLASAKGEEILTAENFEKIIGKVNDLVFVTDINGIINSFFGRYLKKLTSAQHELLNKPIRQIFVPEYLTDFDTKFNLVKSKRQSESMHVKLIFDKEDYFFNCWMEPLINKRGQTISVFFFLTDISETSEKISALENERDELKEYRTIIEAVTDAVFIIDLDGKVKLWHYTSQNLFGYSERETINSFFGKIFDSVDERFFNRIKEELNKSNSYQTTFSFTDKNKSKRIIQAKFTKSDDIGNTILVLCSDITLTAYNEKQLRESERNFKSLAAKTFAGIVTLDRDGKILFVNPAVLKQLKYTKEELLDKNFNDIIDKNSPGSLNFNLSKYEKGFEEIIDLNLISKKDEIKRYAVSVSVDINSAGNFEKYICYLLELGNKLLSDQTLFLFKNLFEHSKDGMLLEQDRKIVLANNSLAEIFGYENSNSLTGKDIIDLVSNNDVLKVAEYLELQKDKKESPQSFEFLAKQKDGTMFYTEFSISKFEYDSKTYLVAICKDITERKRVQQAIRASEEKYRSLTENIDDFLYTFERTGKRLRPVFYTASVEKVTGYTQTDFLSDSKLFLKIIYPDDFNLVKNKLKSLIRSKIQQSEEFEFRIINKHGNVVWVRNKINTIRSLDSKINKIYGLVSDITLRKKAEDELQKSTQNLLKLNETKDRFISIVSHDLRTPFSSILGFTDLLINDLDLTEEEKKQYVHFIQESAKSMLSLVNSLLDWTRLQTGRIRFEPDRVAVNSIIDASIKALSGTTFQKNIAIESEIGEDVFVFVDKNLVSQVFNNLISNAIKFTREGGRIMISAKHAEHVRFIEFSVKDNGVGIKPGNIDKLFGVDTKFTSEGTAGEKGSGLGLSLVSEIIQKHGGRIWVESEYEKGSDFKFLLPIASANILLVDNSNTDRILYSKILNNITPDYTIETASNGKEAFEKISTSPPALIISENLMPVMNGYDLIKELKKSDLKGKPPLIILSSNIDRQGIEDYHELGIEYVFQKPVNLSNFKQAVEKSLRKGLTNYS